MGESKNDKLQLATLATFATLGAKEWGIPDWRDAEAYGDVKRWTDARWRWEFTRRRDDYRDETLAYSALCDKVEAALVRWKETGKPDAKCAWETLKSQARIAWGQYWHKWGYSYPLDPRVSDYPNDDLLHWPHGGVTSMLGSPTGRKRELRNTLTPEANELAVTINLDRPIAEQMELVRKAAKREQKERHGRVLQKREHQAKWLGYLRTLDAREAMPSVSWREYTDALYTHGILDRHKSPSGGYCAPPPQAGRDIWETANALRFNF